MMTYTVYKVELNGSNSNKEHLNNIDEVNVWLSNVAIRGFNNVKIVRDKDSKKVLLTRNQNNEWVR